MAHQWHGSGLVTDLNKPSFKLKSVCFSLKCILQVLLVPITFKSDLIKVVRNLCDTSVSSTCKKKRKYIKHVEYGGTSLSLIKTYKGRVQGPKIQLGV